MREGGSSPTRPPALPRNSHCKSHLKVQPSRGTAQMASLWALGHALGKGAPSLKIWPNLHLTQGMDGDRGAHQRRQRPLFPGPTRAAESAADGWGQESTGHPPGWARPLSCPAVGCVTWLWTGQCQEREREDLQVFSLC